MKTGRPEYHIPSPETISRDVKKVFLRVRKRMAKMLQVSILIVKDCSIIVHSLVGPQWGIEFRDRCLDFPQQQSVRGRLRPFRKRRCSDLDAVGYCGSRAFTLRSESGSRICKDPRGIWD